VPDKYFLVKERLMRVNIDKSTVIFLCFFIPAIVLLFKFGFYPMIKQCFSAAHIVIEDGFIFKAGGSFDDITLSFPFVTVGLNRENLFIKYTGIILNLNYDSIITVNKANAIFGPNGVEIKHIAPGISTKIIIWTPFNNKMMEYLKHKLKEEG